MKQRLAPFLVLLEARYAPLLFAVAPQAYAVYLWLWNGSDLSSASFTFAVMGGIGYEFVYVGAIAWAEEGRSSLWTWLTATVALLFSVAVAYYVYRAQGAWAWLHAGFPLVAFAYTLNMYTHSRVAQPSTEGGRRLAPLEALPERLEAPEAARVDDVDTLADLLDLSAPVATTQNGYHEPSTLNGSSELTDDELFDIYYDESVDLSVAQTSGGIYAIENAFNARIYIGSTVCFDRRRKAHRHQLRRGRHPNQRLQNDWDASLEPRFVFRILSVGIDNLLEQEQVWINEFVAQRGASVVYNMDTPHAVVKSNGTRLMQEFIDIADVPVTAKSLVTYPCPFCGAALRSKQALGAAAKNKHCPECKPSTRVAA